MDSKSKSYVFKSMVQIILLIIILVLIMMTVDYFDSIGDASEVYSYVLFIIGIIGSIIIVLKNRGKRNYIRKYIIFSTITVIVTGAIIIPYSLYGENQRANRICGSDGNLYYCDSDELISCDNEVAVKDGDSYKCVSEEEYRHDYLNIQYDYYCIAKDEIDDSNFVTSMMKEEKSCLETRISLTMKEFIDSKSKEFENEYDIRNIVSVSAGDQGKSDTCELWSSTKALEISAQLKGLDYQYLIDFESKINNLDANIDGIIGDDGVSITLGSDHMIPGEKKYYLFNYTYDQFPNNQYESVYVYSKELVNLINEYRRILSKIYKDNGGFNIYDEFEQLREYDRDIEKIYTKQLVKKYGSAFIHTSDGIQPGHRMIIIGWDDSKNSWLVLNSWGNKWNKDDYVPTSNGDGTTWIKYSDKNFTVGSVNDGGNSIELIGK